MRGSLPPFTIPAAAAAWREGLTFSVEQLIDVPEQRLILRAGPASILLTLGKTDGEFLFRYGKARIEPTSGDESRAWVDRFAAWLGLELVDAQVDLSAESSATLEMSWVRLGNATDRLGMPWRAYKLFFRLDDRYAEVFFRLSASGSQAQFVEKWSDYRRTLVEILERALAPAPPRLVRELPQRLQGPQGETLLSLDRAVALAIPQGWITAQQPEGHWKLCDPDDEYKIEVSCLALPPLPPDAPDVRERLRAVIAGSDYASSASPIVELSRGDTRIAWSEYPFDSLDDKRPEAAPRPAIGRWLIAANEWVQALVTGCWWVEDREVAERGWDAVVESLQLRGRVEPLPPSGSDSQKD